MARPEEEYITIIFTGSHDIFCWEREIALARPRKIINVQADRSRGIAACIQFWAHLAGHPGGVEELVIIYSFSTSSRPAIRIYWDFWEFVMGQARVNLGDRIKRCFEECIRFIALDCNYEISTTTIQQCAADLVDHGIIARFWAALSVPHSAQLGPMPPQITLYAKGGG